MDPAEDIVPPPYGLEDAAPPPESALSLRVPVFNFDPTYSHGLNLGRAPQLRPGLFVGRDSELENLSRCLIPGSPTRNILAIAAVGGLGKTQLAITYAERHHQKYSSVFWLDAKDEPTLKQELSSLADTILEQSHATAASNEDSVIKQVKQWFSSPNNDRWLLILDNYDDPKLPGIKSTTSYDIRSYFPSRNQGSILITTRSKKLGFAECLELKKFKDVTQGLEILSLRSGQDLAKNAGAMALASRLAGFPLALATAGAYIGQSTSECSTWEYLALYNQRWHELQENADQLLEYEDRTLFSTWNLSLERVRKLLPAAAELMSFFAYLGNSGLDYELFRTARDSGFGYRAKWLEALTESKTVFNKSMAVLQNYSLVEYSPQGYSLHTCVHDWTLQTLNENLEPERYWDAMLCVASNVRGITSDAYSCHSEQRLVQHATQLWRVQLKQPFDEDSLTEDQAYSLDRIGRLWFWQKAFNKAEPLLSCALNAYDRLYGSNDRRTLIVLTDFADLQAMMRLFIVAEEIYLRALKGCKTNLLPMQDLLYRLQNSLASLYIDQHKLPEAELLLREALALQETASGLEGHWKLYTMSNLACVLCEQSNFLEAETLSQGATTISKNILGKEHEVTLRAMVVRANVHFCQEQWEQTEMLYSMILDIRQRLYGPDHARTLNIIRQLGRTHLEAKNLDGLVELAKMWGSKERSLYKQLACLGRIYLRNGNKLMARTAYANAIYLDGGILTIPETAWCDICWPDDDKDEHISLAMGRFICLTCDDIDLCRKCHEKYQAGKESVVGCVGHEFFEVPSEMISDQEK